MGQTESRHFYDCEMITALMDRSAFAFARVFEQASKKLPSYTNLLAGIVPKILRPEPFVSQERGALLEIARAMKAASVKLFTSRVGYDEGHRVARWPDMPSELDIFANLGITSFEWSPLPFDFAKIPGFYGNDSYDTNRYKRVLGTIIGPSWVEGLLRNPDKFKLTAQETQNIRNIVAILKLAGPKNDHLLDIFQLWTAEVNHFDSFITCDKKFIRYMTQSAKNPFHVIPILPSGFCDKHAIAFTPLGPANKEDFYTWGEAPLTRMIDAHDRREPCPRSWATRNE